MSFDKETRNLLAKTVAACRTRLVDDVRDQLSGRFGLHPDGTILSLDRLTHLSPDQLAAAGRLRDLLAHFAAGAAGRDPGKAAYDRMVLEIAFTSLNRLAVLRLCEERGLVIECVRKGAASDGFQMFERVSGGALGERLAAYRVFLECLFDELALDLGLLFDRTTPQSAVFPSEQCLEAVLAELNREELARLWAEDETIGWIFQYFNPPEERRAMREASQAPRNSRELAVRNQFFTPRYVVEFLTDNTLGRIWYEMRQGDTALVEECRYLVRRPQEVFLGPGEQAPESGEDESGLSQEELLKRPAYIGHRPKKDPRDLRVLDPACGSGHFLLYAFDLLERIYEEAWEDDDSPKSEITGRTLREDFADLDELRREVPRLIIAHNLHGIDIDPRAVQIAASALWLRAQKSWKRQGLKAAERPRIVAANIVTAEPMPGDEAMRRDFVEGLEPRVLGQIVDEVFDKMRLAGEAGPLLKIEEEIREAVAAAERQWRESPKPEQQTLFPGAKVVRPKQMDLRFDVRGIADAGFWGQAEDRILEALKEYAERAENGEMTRRRLFAEDAARGFAFIELCRKRYDVVLMNPPFGAFSKEYKKEIESNYPKSGNDIYAAFVDRLLFKLSQNGYLGAITSRACFFINSFIEWRDYILRDSAHLVAMADLGVAVMDDAMVEASAYILCHINIPNHKSHTLWFRGLSSYEREQDLQYLIKRVKESELIRFKSFIISVSSFEALEGHPYVYWIESAIIKKLSSFPQLEPTFGTVRKGLRTGDNFRFIRCLWEVPNAEITPDVLPFADGGDRNSSRFVPLVLSGSSQPWFSPLLVLVNWKSDGKELRAFVLKYGTESRLIQGKDFYFRPGISWTRRATRFIPYAVPSGCIPTGSRPMAFPVRCSASIFLAVTASNISSSFMRFYGDEFHRPNFLEGKVKLLPWPTITENDTEKLKFFVDEEIKIRRMAYRHHEPFHDFLMPHLDITVEDLSNHLIFDHFSLLQEDNEYIIRRGYGLTDDDSSLLCSDLFEALKAGTGKSVSDDQSSDELDQGDAADESTDTVLDDSAEERARSLVSYFLGLAFGRWDIRYATGEREPPELPDPFAPLPICPPGMLQNEAGLPAAPEEVASDYPLRISWNGVLVDDPGFDGGRPHADDIVRRVREVFDLLWHDKAQDIEQEACDILGVADLRDYFRKPSGFFQDHLKRYSKSRRKAPIYWPLSTASGSYTLWLYYHRLTDQTLYMAVNRYVEPKIAEVERGIAQLEGELGAATGRAATRLNDRLAWARAFAEELRALREELLRVAALPYRPDLNDGVIINAAPLHRLFRLRPWAKDTEDCWKKLTKGDYDWAHLAYTIWPERVREVCKKDRSIAIAHGLEELCEVAAPEPGKKRGRRKKTAEPREE